MGWPNLKYLLLGLSPYIHASLLCLTPTAARMAAPASAPDTRALVADFVGYKLRQKGMFVELAPGRAQQLTRYTKPCRAAGDEFETRFRRTFSDLAAQLHVTPGSAQQRFTQVSDELFQGGPNWGRLVASLSLEPHCVLRCQQGDGATCGTSAGSGWWPTWRRGWLTGSTAVGAG